MIERLRHGRTGLVAIAAALAIALQALLASYSMAAGVAMPTVDAFGNPLCLSHMADGDQDPGKDGTHIPPCCTLACGMAVSLAPPARGVAIFFNPLAQPSDRIADAHAGPVRPVRLALPGYPRAPPLSA